MSAFSEGVPDVALVVPLSGPAGMFGPSSELCAQLAAEELNEAGGLLGRQVRLVVVDGAGPPDRVADEVDLLITCGAVAAVVGWHISAVRQALVPRIDGRVPYVYTAVYEGGDTAAGVFLTGETPRHQILPSLQWLAREFGVRRWGIVGNDYVWPRRSAAAAASTGRVVLFGVPGAFVMGAWGQAEGADGAILMIADPDAALVWRFGHWST